MIFEFFAIIFAKYSLNPIEWEIINIIIKFWFLGIIFYIFGIYFIRFIKIEIKSKKILKSANKKWRQIFWRRRWRRNTKRRRRKKIFPKEPEKDNIGKISHIKGKIFL